MKATGTIWLTAAFLASFACQSLPAPVAMTGPQAPGLPMQVERWPQETPGDAVVLVHEVGLKSAVWSAEEGMGLVNALWKAGLQVFAVEFDTPSSLQSLAADLTTTLSGLREMFPTSRWFVIGHGLGGTAAYLAASQGAPLAGLVALGAPLTFGGSTAAFRALLERAREVGSESAPSWSSVRDEALIPTTALLGGAERMVITTGWPEEHRDAFYRQAVGTLPAALLGQLRDAAQATLPTSPEFFPGLRRALMTMLIITAPADGLAPPWQCDPFTLGLRRNTIERVYLTRANGTETEYNHMDLVWHPNARREVLPLVVDWLLSR